jgi:pilus assembly protein FimV
MSPGLVAIVATVLLTLALLLMAWRRRRNKGSTSEAKSAQPEQSGQEDEFAVREPTVANLDADTAAMLDDLDPEPAGDSAVSPRKKPLLVSPSSLPSMTGSSSDDEDIIETRIKLAIAFAEVGDEQGARELLQEVLEDGDEEQRMAAQLLIDELDDQN